MQDHELYWSSRSPFVRKVMIFAHETGLADRLALRPQITSARTPDPDLMRVSPANRIPALVRPDGTVLLESHFICEYLDTLHARPPLFPSGQARWSALRRSAIAGALQDNLVSWQREKSRPVDDASNDFRAAYRQKLSSCLAAMESEGVAEASPPRFDIGDVSLAATLSYVDFRFADTEWRKKSPSLADWLDEISQRPSMQATAFSQ